MAKTAYTQGTLTGDPNTQFHASGYLENVSWWLNLHNESLNFGLKSAQDAIKLHHEWVTGWSSGKIGSELCDYEYDDDGIALAPIRKKILGYDPLEDFGHSMKNHPDATKPQKVTR